MSIKTRTAQDLKPGMVVRTSGVDTQGTRLDVFRQVADVRHFAYSDLLVTFTDGTTVRVGKTREFQVSVSKATRNAAKARAATIVSNVLADTLSALLGAYARTAVTAR